ncbi:ester hydrolase C11orf54 homolog [Contarinia nasturtii]|uniref:ester hydrolase C11orf54 homolog n=1 Tax=Contarinia nasturtii TaxID=265458 RepID=UPI0012D37D11|nr:ester hydrolase C11orf54 homolog [Contarinia nasturtii]
MAAIDLENLQWIEKPLYVPSLSEMVAALSTGLQKNFAEVSVKELESPDLTAEPFHLAASGLFGSPTIINIASPQTVDRTQVYDVASIGRRAIPNAKSVFVCGAGAGPHPLNSSHCEVIYNLKANDDGSLVNETHFAALTAGDELCDTVKYPQVQSKFAFLANLFVSEGLRGKVLHVKCKKRTGKSDFITACRNSVGDAFGNKNVGVGGVFLLKNGNAYQHLLRDFVKARKHRDELVESRFKFFEMPGTLTGLGTFVFDEMDFDLRVQHFHTFSNSNWGGHYHYDTTPDTVEYEAFFNVAHRLIRVDHATNIKLTQN